MIGDIEIDITNTETENNHILFNEIIPSHFYLKAKHLIVKFTY